jgi:hypothetical protein
MLVCMGDSPSLRRGEVVASSLEVGSVKLGRTPASNLELSNPLRLIVSTEFKPEGPFGKIVLGVLTFDILSY